MTVAVASGFVERARGLAWRASIPAGSALMIEHCRSIHTIGMRFALDLLWLDAEGRVIRSDYNVPPMRVRFCWRARSVVEVTAGEGQALLNSDYTSAR